MEDVPLVGRVPNSSGETSVAIQEKKEDEEEEKKQCIFCFDGHRLVDGEEDQLIVPCECKNMPIHRSCLDKWRSETGRGQNFARCERCHFVYQTEPVEVQTAWSEKQYRQYYRVLIWVLFQALSAFGLGVVLLTWMTMRLDQNRGWLLFPYVSSTTSYVLWGLIWFCACLDVYGAYLMCSPSEEERARGGGGGRGGGCGSDCPDCRCLDCGRGCHGGSGGDSELCAIALVVIVILVVVGIGVFIGTAWVGKELHKGWAHHRLVLDNYNQARRVRVKDRTQPLDV